MLVLNNLPNVQILNGRSTKDDDDEEEDENGDEDLGEINDTENNQESNVNNKYSNVKIQKITVIMSVILIIEQKPKIKVII